MILRTDVWRRLNAAAAVAWLAVIPIALWLLWLQSVTFVAAVSLYANVVSHVAAWRADEPDPEVIARLDRIETLLQGLLAEQAA